MPGKPERYWRSYGTDPLPVSAEAMAQPFAAFPSWLLRVTCDRCGKDRMFAETHFKQRDMQLRDIVERMRHDGCGGRAGRVDAAKRSGSCRHIHFRPQRHPMTAANYRCARAKAFLLGGRRFCVHRTG
jgi:hypothetical protein